MSFRAIYILNTQSLRAHLANKKHLSLTCSNIFWWLGNCEGSGKRCYVLGCLTYLHLNIRKWKHIISYSSFDPKPRYSACPQLIAKKIELALLFQYFQRRLYVWWPGETIHIVKFWHFVLCIVLKSISFYELKYVFPLQVSQPVIKSSSTTDWLQRQSDYNLNWLVATYLSMTFTACRNLQAV